MTRPQYRAPTALELREARRLKAWFPYRIVWGYLDGEGTGLWVWNVATTMRAANAYARKGFAVVTA